MNVIIIIFFCFVAFHVNVNAELSPSSCSLLRTITSIATITPELAQLAMRYYRSGAVSFSNERVQRTKRFLLADNPQKNTPVRGTMFDQVVANAFKDVNFTRVALLMLQNNETMAKLRQNIDTDTIVRALMRDLDYEKLGNTFWFAAETEFDAERFIASIVNITHIDLIHQEFIANGTVPNWLITNFHAELSADRVNSMISQLRNYTFEMVRIISNPDRLDNYLFETIQDQFLVPLGTVIQRVKNEKPTSLDQLVELLLSNVNKVITVSCRKKPSNKIDRICKFRKKR